MSTFSGKITQVIGPVVDVNFSDAASLPDILDSIEVILPNDGRLFLKYNNTLVKTTLEPLQWILLMD